MSERSAKVFVHAPNVHQGGGKSLLTALLNSFPGNLKTLAQLDSRMTLPANMPENLTIKFVEPSIQQRLRAEWWLAQNVQPQDAVLCFGNLPPLFKLQGQGWKLLKHGYFDRVDVPSFISLKKREAWIYERTDPLPRAYLVGRCRNLDDASALVTVRATSFDPLGEVVLPPNQLCRNDLGEGN